MKEMLGRSCFTELSRNTELQNLLCARPCSSRSPASSLHLQQLPSSGRPGWDGRQLPPGSVRVRVLGNERVGDSAPTLSSSPRACAEWTLS